MMTTFARRTTATLGAAALLSAPLTVMTAAPAVADDGKERHFRVAGAKVNFEVEKDDGKFEVEVDIDDARKAKHRFRIILKHDGKRFFRDVRKAGADRDIEIDRKRRDTNGKDVFKVRVKKVGGEGKTRTIRMR